MSLPYYHTHLHIVHGPNLNLLGIREPELYGVHPFEYYLELWRAEYKNVHIAYFQSNGEGALIDYLHKVGFESDGIILNAAAYSHTSIAIADAVKAIRVPVVELHISDVDSREEYRRHSYLTQVCMARISGKGYAGYKEAIELHLERKQKH